MILIHVIATTIERRICGPEYKMDTVICDKTTIYTIYIYLYLECHRYLCIYITCILHRNMNRYDIYMIQYVK